MNADQIAAVAASIDLPPFLNRWARMTPEALAANELARESLRKEKFMAKDVGSKEKALREAREAAAKAPAEPKRPKGPTKPEAQAPAKPQAAEAAAADQESDVLRRSKSKAKRKGGARTAVKAKTTPAKKGGDHSPQAVGDFISREGGCTMDELVKKFGIEAHPMRAKIHAAKHDLGFDIKYDHAAKRYTGTAPKKKAAAA